MGQTSGYITTLSEISNFGPLVLSGAWETPLIYLMGANFNPMDGKTTGFRNVRIIGSNSFPIPAIPDLGDGEDLGKSESDTLTWAPVYTQKTTQYQSIHFLNYDIGSTQLAESGGDGGFVIPTEQGSNPYVDLSRLNFISPFEQDVQMGFATIAQNMEWVFFNSTLQIPTTPTEKFKAQGLINGCVVLGGTNDIGLVGGSNYIDAQNGELTSTMLEKLSLMVPPMRMPVLFIGSEFFSQIREYTIPTGLQGQLSQALNYASLSVQPVQVVVSPKLSGKNAIVLVDMDKLFITFKQMMNIDDTGQKTPSDVIFILSEVDKKTGATQGRVGTYVTIDPTSFSYHAVIINVYPEGMAPP